MDQEKNTSFLGSNQHLGDIENFDLLDKENSGTYNYGEPLLTRRINTTSQIAIVGANLCPIESLDYE